MPKVRSKTAEFSKSLEDFCEKSRQALSDYAWNKDEIQRLDKLTQDYLHKLELDELGYKERAKIATALRDCRRLRRQSKDTVEILEPFVMFLNSERGKNMMNLMNEALGKTRKIEEHMRARTYRYKVLEVKNEP